MASERHDLPQLVKSALAPVACDVTRHLDDLIDLGTVRLRRIVALPLVALPLISLAHGASHCVVPSVVLFLSDLITIAFARVRVNEQITNL